MLDESREISSMLEESGEMNKVELYHCNRCHSVLKTDTHEYMSSAPIIVFEPPTHCMICKSAKYQKAKDVVESYLPKPEKSVRCKCRFPSCEKEFNSRPNWYQRQQQLVEATGNPWMPALIETDPEKIKLFDLEEETAST